MNASGSLTGTLAGAAAVFCKEWRAELRSRVAWNATLMFAVTTLVAVSFAARSLAGRPEALAALLWVVLLFAAASGLPRTFVREEESGTVDALRLSAGSLDVYLGKWAFSLALLAALELVVVPLFLALMDGQVRDLGVFLGVLAVGSVGLSAASTLVAALVAKAGGQGALFGVLAFPILLPVVVFGVQGTQAALAVPGAGGLATPEVAAQAASALKLLIAYGGVVAVSGVLLFEWVWSVG